MKECSYRKWLNIWMLIIWFGNNVFLLYAFLATWASYKVGWYEIPCLILLWLGLFYCILVVRNKRMVLTDHRLIYWDFLGVQKELHIDDITKIIQIKGANSSNRCEIYFNKRKVKLYEIRTKGYTPFIEALCQALHIQSGFYRGSCVIFEK